MRRGLVRASPREARQGTAGFCRMVWFKQPCSQGPSLVKGRAIAAEAKGAPSPILRVVTHRIMEPATVKAALRTGCAAS
jgi:hypothetical protein